MDPKIKIDVCLDDNELAGLVKEAEKVDKAVIKSDKSVKNLEGTVTKTGRASKLLSGVWNDLTKSFVAANLVTDALRAGLRKIGQAARDGVNFVKDFQTSITNISTLISGDATKAVNDLSDGILEISQVVPKSPEELGAAAYGIVSAGITDTADALKVLETSAKLGTAGLGTTEESAKILTGAINAFGLDAADADRVANVLFETVQAGTTTVQELSRSFGQVAPAARTAGITLEEVQAATAALTTSSLQTSVAQTQLRQLFIELNKEGTKLDKAFEEVGISNVQAAIKTDGFVSVLSNLKDGLELTDVEFQNLFGSAESAGAAVSLTGAQYDAFSNTLNSLRDSTSSLEDAFAKQLETVNSQTQIFRNNIDNLINAFGSNFLDTAVDSLKDLNSTLDDDSLEQFLDNVGSLVDGLISSFLDFTDITRDFFAAVSNSGGLTDLIELLGEVLALVGDSLSFGFELINELIGAFTSETQEAASSVNFLIPILNFLTDVIVVLRSVISQASDQVSSFIGLVGVQAGAAAELFAIKVQPVIDRANQIYNLFIDVQNAIAGFLDQITGGVFGKAVSLVSSAAGTVAGFFGDQAKAAANTVKGFADQASALRDQAKAERTALKAARDREKAERSANRAAGGGGGGGGGASRADQAEEERKAIEDLAKERAKAQSSLNKQIRESLIARQELIKVQDDGNDLTASELRLLDRLNKEQGKAYNPGRARNLNEILEAINKNSEDWEKSLKKIDKELDNVNKSIEKNRDEIADLVKDIEDINVELDLDITDNNLDAIQEAAEELAQIEKELSDQNVVGQERSDLRDQQRALRDQFFNNADEDAQAILDRQTQLANANIAERIELERQFNEEALTLAANAEIAKLEKEKEIRQLFDNAAITDDEGNVTGFDEEAIQAFEEQNLELLSVEQQRLFQTLRLEQQKNKNIVEDARRREAAITEAISQEIEVREQIEKAAADRAVDRFEDIRQAAIRAYQAQQLASGGFATGGYTGDMATNAVAGVVHGQEYVLNARATRMIDQRLGRDFLDNANFRGVLGGLQGYKDGGRVENNNSKTNNITLHNYGDAARVVTDPTYLRMLLKYQR